MAPSRAIRKPPPSQASENPPTEEELLEFAKATIKNSWGREGYEVRELPVLNNVTSLKLAH